MVAHNYPTNVKPIISAAIPVSKYKELSVAELIVLSMLETLAPKDATSWPCDYDELISMADNSPNVESSQVISIMSRMVEAKIIDFSFSLVDAKLQLRVCPWGSRSRLRQDICDDLIARRAAAKVSPAA